MNKTLSFWLIILLISLFLLPVTGWTLAAPQAGVSADGMAANQQIFLPVVRNSPPMEMVYVPAGEFQRGCATDHNGGYPCPSSELPLHTVYLDTFYIDQYEVTNAQYALCVMNGACPSPADSNSSTRSSYHNNPAYADYPVINITWSAARDYCQWASKRLPTEAEWEKAARGAGAMRSYPWGHADPNCTLANHNYYNGSLYEDCVGDTSQVGSYPDGASSYGALDMAGNVWEWVNDWWQSDYYGVSPDTNPPGPTSGSMKVVRGGSWGYIWTALRVANRSYLNPDLHDNLIGFRCVASSLP